MSIVSTAPLGMRFADPMTGATVASGLDVAARGPGSARFVNARPGAGGVYAFHGLSGLIAVERAERIPGGSTTQVAGDANWWQHHQGKVACEVRVRDPQKRFQPFRFVAPLPHRGLFAPPCAAPPAGVEPFVPLFSAPGRPAPAGMAVVRAELWDRVADRAAAWARLEVWHGATRVGHGFADAEGRAAIYFRPPPFTEAPLVAGQPAPGITLTGQQWTLTVRVGYAHDAQAKDAPDLCTVLTQPAARVWGALGPPETELQSTTLRFGQALVLQTAGAARSKLLITPQGSPP